MKMIRRMLGLVFAVLAIGLAGQAKLVAEVGGACVHRPAPAGAQGKRVAVIVGDGAYRNGIPALPNPTHDATAVAKAVGALGFETFVSTDADSAALQKCLDAASASLPGTDVAMFYYSGHGIQIQDANYLVATDAGSKDLKHGFVAVQPIVDALQKQAKATLVLLDACRNNPMVAGGQAPAGLSVSTGRGLARVRDPSVPKDAPVAGTPGVVQARGLMVAYATSPNAVAQDGTGTLSPFTGAFVAKVVTSGYSIQRVMSDVNKAVGEATDWRQTPWMKSSLTGELKLGGGQTLAEARSVSDNHAARSASLLDTDGRREPAIVEALKGLPAAPDEAALARFDKAYRALYRAVQSREIVLPLSPGMTLVAVSTRDRAAVYRLSADYRSGTLDLWSVSEQKIVATPDIRGPTEKFAFSPHGTMLAAVGRGGTSVFDGVDGTELFDIRAHASSVEFSPDEKSLLLADVSAEKATIVDIATRKPTLVVRMKQLDPGTGKGRATSIDQLTFSGNDALCFTLRRGSDANKAAYGVFDLKAAKTARLRETDESTTAVLCDPAGKYMVRGHAVGANDQGMEIWDLANDKVTQVDAPIGSILGVRPEGDYIGVLGANNEARGLWNLATGKKGYPPHVPDDYWILGARVRNTSGGLVSQDVNPNPWRDWPDETLYGPALVAKALAELTQAQRDEIARERITFATVAANP